MDTRIGGLGGLVFVVGILAGVGLAPLPPAPGAQPEEVYGWFAENASGIALAGMLGAVATLGILVFVAAMLQRLGGGPERSGLVALALTGTALAGAGWIASYALSSATALAVDHLDPSATVLSYAAYGALASVGSMGFVALMAGVAALGAATAAVPRWLSLLAWAGAAVHLASAAALVTDSTVVFSLVYLSFGILLVWVVGGSVVLLRPSAEVGGTAPVPA